MSRNIIAGLVVLLMVMTNCSTTRYQEAADREVYGIIEERSSEVPGMAEQFSIDEQKLSLEGLPVVSPLEAEVFLREAGFNEEGSRVLSLEKALELAVNNGRDYQSSKESLYLQVLGLTETRQQYTPIFGGAASVGHRTRNVDVVKPTGAGQLAAAAPDVLAQVGAVTGTSAQLLAAYADLIDGATVLTGADQPEVAIAQERSVSGATSVDVSMLMKGGARIALSLTSNFLRYTTGDPRTQTASSLVASLQQPLLGGDRHQALETLTQAERNTLYQLRGFTRFRKSYSIDVASNYYEVLRARDRARNNWLGYQAFLRNLERDRAMADADRITRTELGRTEESALQSENNWVTAVQSYQDRLDEFKVQLGLTTDAQVVLNPDELERLRDDGLKPSPGFSLEDAVDVAKAVRLDYQTERDRAEDARRKLELAKDDLLPDIDVSVGASVNSEPGDRFQELDWKHYAWDAGLDFDPKLNRKRVRNQLRAALIDVEAADRGLQQFEDSIKLQVRRAWRNLEQARISYEIQKNSVEVNERRVLEQELKQEIGQSDTLALIDAQNDLIRARNSLSSALVDHNLAYLRLWLNMGILYIKNDGQWEDIVEYEPSGSVPDES